MSVLSPSKSATLPKMSGRCDDGTSLDGRRKSSWLMLPSGSSSDWPRAPLREVLVDCDSFEIDLWPDRGEVRDFFGECDGETWSKEGSGAGGTYAFFVLVGEMFDDEGGSIVSVPVGGGVGGT